MAKRNSNSNNNGNDNLIRPTPEQARENGRKGGLKSAEVRKAKKTMRETAKLLLSMDVAGENNRKNLEAFGIEDSDMNYQTAIAVRLLQKALKDGDTNAARMLVEMSGEHIGLLEGAESPDIVDQPFPDIQIPDNGRDARKGFILAPQAGPQTQFMSNDADIIIYGGAAGGGKTFALLLEALRHKDVRGFEAAIFRDTYTQITAPGGLWDASHKIFDQVAGAEDRKTPKFNWTFSGRGRLTFAHIGGEDDLKNWQGTEIAYIGFDELTHFSKHQFLYMLSRNRSTCGVRPYVRATCNPDSDSWVAEFIAWWIDQKTGYPIPERSGQIRWMVNINDETHWFDTKDEGIQFALSEGMSGEEAETMAKSVTFIASSIKDNKILMKVDPGYMANLRALSLIDMERLLKGNWKIKAAAGLFFRRTQVEVIDAIPADIISWVRGWDLAASVEDKKGDPDYTASCLMGKRRNGMYVIADVINRRLSASEVRVLVKMTAQADKRKYGRVMQKLSQDPGQAGKEQAQSYIKMLAGFTVKTETESSNKETRAEPLAAQWQVGNVQILNADWNEMYFNQMESFPESKHDDMVDGSSSAFNELESGNVYSAPSETDNLAKESYWRG